MVINEGPAVKLRTRVREEEHRDAHCIIGARLNNRTVPNLPNVVLLTSIRSLFEVVMQRRVKDAELYMGVMILVNRTLLSHRSHLGAKSI